MNKKEMRIKANDYKPNEILRIVRDTTDLTQKAFAESIGKSEDWCQSNELGRSNYYFKDFLELANKHGIEIYVVKKW